MEELMTAIVTEDYTTNYDQMSIMYVVRQFEEDDDTSEDVMEFMFPTFAEAMTFAKMCMIDTEAALEEFHIESDIKKLEAIDHFEIYECLVFFDQFGHISEIDEEYTTLAGAVYMRTDDISSPAAA